MDTKRRCFIIGGGASIQEGLDTELQEKIFDEFKIVCNFAFRYFDPEILTFVDYSFFKKEKELIKRFPLFVTKNHKNMTMELMNYPNAYVLHYSKIFHGYESLKKGIYTPLLCGIFSLTLAIALNFEEIYLLGMDFGSTDPINNKSRTHFYQDKFNHRGIGTRKDRAGREIYTTGVYKNNPQKYYYNFKDIQETVNIYNVSPNSSIQVFPKITYKEMYKKIIEEKAENRQEVLDEVKLRLAEARINMPKYEKPLNLNESLSGESGEK